MRVLFHVEPLVMHGRPLHYWAWLARCVRMARALEGRGHACRFLLNEALAERALAPLDASLAGGPQAGHALPAETVVSVRQDDVRSHFDVPNIEILRGFHRGTWPEAVVAACGATLRAKLGGFEPGVIVTFTPAAHLAAANPGALVLHAENGMFSRAPFPPTQYFDPAGLYANSVPAVCAAELKARRPSAVERARLDVMRAEYRAWLLAASPFHALERRMRARFRRLALLPLQFGGEAGFDLNGPFRNQGELLLHVLERLPDGIGLVVTEHPTAHWLGEGVDEETRRWIGRRWPQVTWVEPAAMAHGSQALMLHVDDVAGLSSSLALQAMFWKKPLYVLGHGLPLPYASAVGVEHLDASRPLGDETDHDGALAWMLNHYFVPESLCLDDAAWVEGFLERSLARHAAGLRGLAFFDAVADAGTLATAYSPPPPPAAAPRVPEGLLRDGAFAAWDEVAAPGASVVPSHWDFLAEDDGSARLTAGDAAGGPRPGGEPAPRPAILERDGGGESPALLLQRIPGIDRLAGTRAAVGFFARGTPGTSVAVYLYQQPDAEGLPAQGTAPQVFALDATWRRYEYVADVPVVDVAACGPGHHTELVFLVPFATVAQRAEITDVTLGDAR